MTVGKGSLPCIIVFLVWACLWLALFAFVALYGSNLPLPDEWAIVPYLVGEQPVTLHWLWEPSSSHRTPLPRLLLVGLARISRCDFRAGMLVSTALLGVICLVMIETARRLRGRVSITDVFIPLLMLHFGHRENVLEGSDIQNVILTALATLSLSTIALARDRLTTAQTLVFGLCLLLMPLNGASGAIMAPLLAAWLFSWAWVKSPEPVGGRVLKVILALAAWVLSGLYFYGLRSNSPPSPSWLMTLQGAVMFLSTSFGAALAAWWPLGGGLIVATIATATAILAAQMRKPEERLWLFGFALYGIAMISVGLAVGWARSGIFPRFGLADRYSILSLPVLLWACVIGAAYRSLFAARLLQIGLCAAMFFFFTGNTNEGLGQARLVLRSAQAFSRDMASGKPLDVVLNRHKEIIPSWGEDMIAPESYNLVKAGCQLLKKAGFADFQNLRALPQGRIVESGLPGGIIKVSRAGGNHTKGVPTSLSIHPAQHVFAIIVNMKLDSAPGNPPSALVHCAWSTGSDTEQARTGQDTTLRFWVDATCDRFTITVDEPVTGYRISQISFFVPLAAGSGRITLR
jgi:hypothetical protein